MSKKGAIKRETVFFILVAIIIIATILIIVFMNNGKKGKNNNVVEDPKAGLEADVNPDATPDTNPSIGGTDNVEEINGEKVNTSNKLKQAKTVGVYTFKNISMTNGSTGTVITATITSTVTEKTSGRDATMKFYDKSGKLVSQMETYIPQVKPGETTTFRTETSSDVSNAYDFEIVLK